MASESFFRRANMLAYLSTTEVGPFPRISTVDIIGLMEALSGSSGHSVGDLPDPKTHKFLFQFVNETIQGEIRRSATQIIESIPPAKAGAAKSDIGGELSLIRKDLLQDLRKHLHEIELFGVTIGPALTPTHMGQLTEIMMVASMREDVLLLVADDEVNGGIELLDPLPAFAAVANAPENWPGVLFWSTTGTFAFVPAAPAASKH